MTYLANRTDASNKRALAFPGGGMRLSYHAGVLVALQEEGLSFDLFDGTSGGSLNMSMLLSGLSPREIVERWTSLEMAKTLSFMSLENYLSVETATAAGDADAIRCYMLPHLGIDFSRIRQNRDVRAAYNVLDYGNKKVVSIPHVSIDENLLIAGMSLPGVFPPVETSQGIFLDTGFLQDVNLTEIVRQGAEEIWLMWGLGNTHKYKGGALNLYVQMLEMSANGSLNREIAEIAALNERIKRGDSPYGQTNPITVHLIKPEYPLPLDTDLYLGKVTHAELIARGYDDAKRYLAKRNSDGVTLTGNFSEMKIPMPTLRYQEKFSGSLVCSSDDMEIFSRNMALSLITAIQGINEPGWSGIATGQLLFNDHSAVFLSHGQVQSIEQDDGGLVLSYQLQFEINQRKFLMNTKKSMIDDPGFDLVSDITTLEVEILSETGESLAHGKLKAGLSDLIEVLKTLHIDHVDELSTQVKLMASVSKRFFGSLYQQYIKS